MLHLTKLVDIYREDKNDAESSSPRELNEPQNQPVSEDDEKEMDTYIKRALKDFPLNPREEEDLRRYVEIHGLHKK